MEEIIIYTDGACSGNPGPGGWGAVLIYDKGDKGKTLEISGYEADTTNNRMELGAAIEALRKLNSRCRVALHSDSAYLVNAFNQRWIENWKRNAWRKRDRTAVLNKDLWEELCRLSEKHSVQWVKVKGHANNPYNERCDELARNAIKTRKRQEEEVVGNFL